MLTRLWRLIIALLIPQTKWVNRIFFESNLFQSEKIKVIYVIDISEYLQQQQQVVPKEDVLEVAKSPHACK